MFRVRRGQRDRGLGASAGSLGERDRVRIKSLQLHGFKSFVDKTVFTFEDGVTAVVGPNGCGKSNVVDAIRWVMGEQSPRRLRGKGMDDVIFAGSETRPAIGMAEVLLTFDNSDGQAPGAFADYGEIQITRRLYRSGESEYLLNKTPCRMRDVHDFFRDTGIGVKGYTIVEQGRIAEIVSAKAEERRALIEEAAGISKYKARRRQAESKIASTEQNLTRVNDVLGEIKRQINTLERQARKAGRYKRLNETQRILELSIAADERRELLAVVENADGRLRTLHEQVTALEAQLAERELAVEQRRIELAEAEKAVSRGAETLYGLRSDIKGLEGQVELNRREVDGLEASNQGREQEIVQLSEQLETARIEAEEAEAELERLEGSLAGEESSIAAAESEARQAVEALRALERDRDSANEGFVGVLTSLARVEDRISAVSDRRSEIDQRLRSADRELELHQSQAHQAGEAQSSLEEGLRNLLSERDRLQEQLRNAMKNHERSGETLKERSEALRIARERYEVRRARLISLQEVIERGEDVGEATRHLMEDGGGARERYGVRGLVREFLEVDADLETAVEALLAERAEAMVVENAAGAVEAIEQLRGAGAGRGVFVVQPQAELPASGIVPLGEELIRRVRPREGFEGMARSLLKDVYVVDSLSQVLETYDAGNLPATFVTPAGDVLSADGVVRGGGEAAGSGMLGRLREVRELEGEVAGLEREALACNRAHETAELELGRAAEELENLRNRHHTAVLAVANHEKDLDRTCERVKNLGEVQEGRVAERSEFLDEAEALAQEIQRLETQLGSGREERTAGQRRLDSLGTKISTSGRELSRLETRATELRVAHGGRVETRDRLQETMNRGRNATRETGEWIARRETEIAAAIERRATLAEQSQQCEAGLAGKLADEEQARVANEQQRETYEAKAEELRVVENEVRECRGELNGSREESSNADLAVRESTLRLEHQEEGIREKWGVEIATWQPPSLAELESQAGELAGAAGGEVGSEVASEVGGEATEELTDEAGADSAESSASEAAQALRDARRNAELVNLDLAERRRHLEKLRSQIQSLGDVNLGAIEEHEELAERFRFLSEQKEDLEGTIHSLREAIARINRTSRKRFRDTFEAVSKCFSENFPRLFGGGRASLMLTEADDILEAGVDIMAMPPGKRNQIVNLLSGGEKTMTALALLMAIFQVRPSPFFLLDEVDAALDDANVGRFNQLITELARESQFLVITHNKRTIEVADILYGVTMEQKGVSKLVSVALS